MPVLPQTATTGGVAGGKSGGKASKQVPGRLQNKATFLSPKNIKHLLNS